MDNLTENIQRGIRQKLRRGEYPDKAPVGYLNEPKLRTIVIDEATAPIVRRMFEACATGKYTMRQLQELVTGWGLRTCFGNPIALSWFPKLLANPFYIGQFRFTGELYDGSHPPLISRDLFDRVQDVLARRSRGPYRKKQKPAFPLRGYFVCGQCGASITAELQKGHNYLDRESVALRVVAVVRSSSESVARSHPSRVPRPARRVAGAVENHRGKKDNFKVVVGEGFEPSKA